MGLLRFKLSLDFLTRDRDHENLLGHFNLDRMYIFFFFKELLCTVFKMGKRQEVNVFWSLGTSLYIYAGPQCNNVFRSWDGAAQRTLNPSINVLLQAFWLFASLFLLCSGLLRPLAVSCLLTTPYFPWLFVWIIGLWEVDPKEKHLNKTLKDFFPP